MDWPNSTCPLGLARVSHAIIPRGRGPVASKFWGSTYARTVWETVLFSSVYATDWWNKDGYFARWTSYKRGKFLQGRPRPCQAKMLWHKAEARSQSPMSLLLIFWPRTGISWQFISSERLLYFELPTHTSLTLFKCMSYLYSHEMMKYISRDCWLSSLRSQ